MNKRFILACVTLISTIMCSIVAVANEQQDFLSVLAEGLNARWEKSDVDESTMSVNQYMKHRTGLVDITSTSFISRSSEDGQVSS